MYTSFAEQQCPLERGMDESPNHQLNQNISCASTWIQQHTDRVLLSTIQAVMVTFRPIWPWDDSVLKEDGFKPLCWSNSSDQLSCESMHIYMDTRTDSGMGSGKRSPYGAQYPWRWASVSTKVEKKGITRQIQNNEGRRHQLIPEQLVQLLPVEQWVLSKSHEVNLTAATWLHRGEEDLQPHRHKASTIRTKRPLQTHVITAVQPYQHKTSHDTNHG